MLKVIRESRLQTQVTMVVARYNEKINWTKQFNNILIYNKLKGKNLLPNVGRESHTYLHYIIEHYNDLPPVIIFSQADIFKHITDDEFSMIKEIVTHGMDVGFKQFGRYRGFAKIQTFENFFKFCFFSKKQIVIPHPVTPTSVIKGYDLYDCPLEYDENFSISTTSCIECVFGATFAVKKERILLRSREWYERVMKLVDWHQSPLAAHFFERAWPYVFGEPMPLQMVITK